MLRTPQAQSASRIDRLSQRARRAAVIGTLSGLPAMYAWSYFWQTTSVPPVVWGPISFLLIAMTVIGAVVLYRYVRNRADMPGHGLDERERQLRDRAWILSYQALSVVVIIGISAVGVLVLGLGQTLRLDANIVNALVLSIGVLIPVLPTAALAWLEPDAPLEA